MKRVILPTDFSDNAWKAMCYAAQLFRTAPTKFVILNNYHAPYQASEVGVNAYFEPMIKASEEGLEEVLANFRDLEHHPESEFETVSNFGPLTATIQNMEAKEDESHFVVMGTTGASGLKEIFLGSTTASVIEGINSPVVCVPNEATLGQPKELMLAIDDEGVDNLAEIRPLLNLAKDHEAKISVLNVHQENKEVVLDRDATERFVLDHYMEGIGHSYYSVDGEYIEDKIMQFAHGMDIDLICLLKRERGFWKNLFHHSMTKSMVYHSDVPLLILRDK
ncbi:MAG: universal stress protein [Flavobacteriales bacterium]|jgi:nucleotide-binding universal stress UspA family protein|nr:universal stress protein [Flavobacteriales bacterium]